MPEVIVNTSPLQYLYQIDLLDLLQKLYREVLVPEGVVREVAAGRRRGIALPDLDSLQWIRIHPVGSRAVLPLAAGLGTGEREVLALALEREGSVVILDDSLARRFAHRLNLTVTGTLGLLLKAQQMNHIEHLRPHMDRLENLGFRLDGGTRESVLRLAGEL